MIETTMSAPESTGLGRALTNRHYRGGRFGWLFLVGMGAMNLFRGSVHTFRADGGAQSIAGIDLSENRQVILSLFATMGWTQLVTAIVDLAVALRFRALAPYLVGYHLAQHVGAVAILWWWRPLPVNSPGKFGSVPLLLFSCLACRSAYGASPPDAERTPPATEPAPEDAGT